MPLHIFVCHMYLQQTNHKSRPACSRAGPLNAGCVAVCLGFPMLRRPWNAYHILQYLELVQKMNANNQFWGCELVHLMQLSLESVLSGHALSYCQLHRALIWKKDR